MLWHAVTINYQTFHDLLMDTYTLQRTKPNSVMHRGELTILKLVIARCT